MKITQKYPLNWYGTMSFEIQDSKIIQSYKNLYSEGNMEYDIFSISPNINYYKQGNNAWVNIGLFFIFLIVILNFLSFPNPLDFILFSIFLLTAIISFLLILKKNEFVGFQDKNHKYLFAIRLSKKSNEEKEFIEQLKNKIEKKN